MSAQVESSQKWRFNQTEDMSQDKYFYENLDFNRFQHLAHAVICADHPETQCLPVGQSDGGRDAFRINEVGEGGFTATRNTR